MWLPCTTLSGCNFLSQGAARIGTIMEPRPSAKLLFVGCLHMSRGRRPATSQQRGQLHPPTAAHAISRRTRRGGVQPRVGNSSRLASSAQRRTGARPMFPTRRRATLAAGAAVVEPILHADGEAHRAKMTARPASTEQMSARSAYTDCPGGSTTTVAPILTRL
jgi:hypothetical protein